MERNQIFLTPTDVLVDEGTRAPTFTMDMVSEFKPTFPSQLTKYRLSDKSQITNHRVRNNATFVLSGYVSSRPLLKYENNLVGYDNLQERPVLAYSLVKKWEKLGTELTIVNKFDVYNNCIITNLSPIQSSGGDILINFQLEQARRVSYKRVNLVQYMQPSKQKDASPSHRESTKSKDVTNSRHIDKYISNNAKRKASLKPTEETTEVTE